MELQRTDICPSDQQPKPLKPAEYPSIKEVMADFTLVEVLPFLTDEERKYLHDKYAIR